MVGSILILHLVMLLIIFLFPATVFIFFIFGFIAGNQISSTGRCSCADGSYFDAALGCILCPPGTYSSSFNILSSSISSCLPCPRASYSSSGATVCLHCPSRIFSYFFLFLYIQKRILHLFKGLLIPLCVVLLT